MGILISLLVRAGLGQRLAAFIAYAILAAALVAAVWWLRSDAYQDGVRANDAKWEEASRRLEQQAADSAKEADRQAAARTIEFNDRVSVEKEKLDEAERTGASPLDVLFGPGDGVR